MKICSVIVGIQHYAGVENVKSGSEVVLVFDEENRYSEDTIVVKNENGEVVGNIIANLNHPSISDEDIILNNIKNDKMIRKTTTTNCKATIKRITKYVIFIVVDTENIVELVEKGDEDMVVLPIEAKESIYTVVGTKYHSTNANVGDIVRFKVVNGTTTLFNEDNESLGVLPQSDKKVKELQEIEAPIVLNQFARTDFNTLEDVFVVSYVVDDKYIFLREIGEEDLVTDEIDAEIQENEIALVGAKKECEVDTMSLKELLKEEFDGVEISGKAWDMAKGLNMLSRNIQSIVNDCPVERISIMTGGKGKFVWIQYADNWDTMEFGGVASGSLEDAPIHYNGVFYDDINYSKIAFALIPVDDL